MTVTPPPVRSARRFENTAGVEGVDDDAALGVGARAIGFDREDFDLLFLAVLVDPEVRRRPGFSRADRRCRGRSR